MSFVQVVSLPDRLRRLADVIESRECTGVSATWCPVHGDCTCPPDPDPRYLNADRCPLHDSASSHAEGLVEPAPVAHARPNP